MRPLIAASRSSAGAVHVSATSNVSIDCANQITGLVSSSPETGARDLLSALPPETREEFVVAAIQTTFSDSELNRLVERLDGNSQRALGVAALSHHFKKDFREVFDMLDKDSSGHLSRSEFKYFLRQVEAGALSSDTSPPTTSQLMLVFCQAALPNVIFGMLDNSIMIVGGDVVDDLIGSTFHLSTLACAAWANTFADVFGMSVGSSVERITRKMGMPQANLSPQQVKLPVVRRISMLAGPLGILFGCIIGMAPLLFRDEDKKAIQAAFARADADNNGVLGPLEAVMALRSFHAANGGDVEGCEEDLKHFETDANGKISPTQFAEGYKKLKLLRQPSKK